MLLRKEYKDTILNLCFLINTRTTLTMTNRSAMLEPILYYIYAPTVTIICPNSGSKAMV